MYKLRVQRKRIKTTLTQLLTGLLPNVNEGKGPQITVWNSLLQNWKLGPSNQRVGSESGRRSSDVKYKCCDQEKELCHVAQRGKYREM